MNILFLYPNVINPKKGGVQRVSYVLGEYFKSKSIGVWYLSLPNSEECLENQLFFPDKKLDSEDNVLFIKKIAVDYSIDILINQYGMGLKIPIFLRQVRESFKEIVTVIHNDPIGNARNYISSKKEFYHRLHLAFILPVFEFALVKKLLVKAYIFKYSKHHKKVLRYSDKVVLLSDRYKDDYIKFVGKEIDYSKLIAINNPCSFVTNDQIPEKENIVLYVGRVTYAQKRVDLLIEIWDKLSKLYPDWNLIIVGGGEKLHETIEKCRSHNIKNVIFTGFQDPSEYYRKASVFCLTSSYEGFCMVLPEAMQNGCVPVAFDSFPSVHDIIDDGINGFLIKPFDIDSYCCQVRRLLDNANLRKVMAAKALSKSNCFSIENIGEQWISLFSNYII